MAMDQLREEYNKDGQKVVFIATSDDFHWIKKHLVDKQARFFFWMISSLVFQNEFLGHPNLKIQGVFLFFLPHLQFLNENTC